jgi:hypothetical protein
MTDIRELLHSAAPVVDDVDLGALRRGARLRRKRQFAATIAGTVALLGTGAAIAVAVNQHSARRGVVVAAPTTTVPSIAVAGTGVEVLPSPAFSPRAQPAMVWTGTSLVVWGGNLDAANMGLPGPYRSFNDGAVYAPRARAWTPMAASPLPATVDQPAGALTDDGVVFARGRATAIWAPATNAWRKLGDAPKAVTDMTSTGSLVVSYSANATLDVASGVWQALPDAPVNLERATFAWTGQELVVVGGPGSPFTSAEAIALDPSRRTWRRIASPPADVHAEALSADWDGGRVVVVNYDMKAIAWDPPRDGWSTLPDVPARFFEWSPTARAVGGATVVFMAQAIVVLTPNGTWVPVPYGKVPFGTIATTRPAFDAQPANEVMYVFGVRNNGSSVLVSIDPARLAAAASPLQIGVGSVRPPSGYRLQASHYDAASDAVDIQLSGPNGAVCSVTSKYTGTASPNFAPLVPESLENDGAHRTWYRSPQGTEWGTAPTTSDSFVVECTDPTAARALAESASFKNGS